MTKIDEIMKLAKDGYSNDRYANWRDVAEALDGRGYTVKQAAAIMLSKWMRWAADRHGGDYGSVPASAVLDFIDNCHGPTVRDKLRDLTRETFPRKRKAA